MLKVKLFEERKEELQEAINNWLTENQEKLGLTTQHINFGYKFKEKIHLEKI